MLLQHWYMTFWKKITVKTENFSDWQNIKDENGMKSAEDF